MENSWGISTLRSPRTVTTLLSTPFKAFSVPEEQGDTREVLWLLTVTDLRSEMMKETFLFEPQETCSFQEVVFLILRFAEPCAEAVVAMGAHYPHCTHFYMPIRSLTCHSLPEYNYL